MGPGGAGAPGEDGARRRRWLLPLVAGVVLVILGIWIVAGDGSAVPAPYGIASLLAATVVLMVAASSGMVAYGAHRRSRGRLTASEREQVLRQEAWTRARQDAVLLRARLLAKDPPPTLQPWDVVAHHGEVFFCDVLAGYARYYGTTVTYPRSSGFFYGRPAFVLTGLAATAIGNAATRARAKALAQEQWREHGPCRLLVSNRRLLTHVRGRWLTFDYSTMTAVYPEPASGALVCQFEAAEPLLITGPHALFAAVMTVFRTHGETALRDHPALEALG